MDFLGHVRVFNDISVMMIGKSENRSPVPHGINLKTQLKLVSLESLWMTLILHIRGFLNWR
jgi:hypothetical protein